MTQPMSIRKLASSLLLGVAAWTVVCPPADFSTRVCSQTARHPANADAQTLDSEFAAAADLYGQQRWHEAAIAFESYIEKHGDAKQAAAANFFLGESWVQQNDFESAYPWYKKFVHTNPRNAFTARATFRMGECAWRTDQHEEALRILEKFTHDYPQHELVEFALPYLGQLRLNRSEPQLAKAAFSLALRLYPDSAMKVDNQMGLANALQALGETTRALELYTAVSDSDSNSAEHKAVIGRAKLRLGIVAFENEQYPAAVTMLANALDRSTGETKIECGYWLARAEIASGNHAAAVELVSALMVAFADSPMPESTGSVLLFEGAIAANKIERNELACIWLDKLQTWYPQHPLCETACALEIRLHHQAGRSDRVLAMFKRLRKTDPESQQLVVAAELAGRAFYARGDYAQTLETFHMLLKKTAPQDDGDVTPNLRSQRSNWLYLKSLGHLGLRQYDEALKELELAEAYNRSADLSALISLARGTAHFGQQQFSRAVEHYHEYLRNSEEGEEAVRASCELALCFVELKQWDDAQHAFSVMQDLGADEMITETTRYLAEKAWEANHKDAAETFYQAMVAGGNSQPVVTRGLSGLAWVNMESMDHPKALSFFKRLIDEYPDSQFSRNAAMARAKFLDDAGLAAEAAEMYALVIQHYENSDAANVARLRKVRLLQSIGGRSNLERARDLLKEQLQQPGNRAEDESLYQLGWVLVDLDQAEEAMARFSRLVDQYPDSKYWADAALRIASRQVRAGEAVAADALADRILNNEHVSEQITDRTMLLKCQLAAEAKDWPEVTRLMKIVKGSADERDASPDASGRTSKAVYWLAESLYQQALYNQSSQEFASLVEDVLLEASLRPWVRLRLAQCLGKLGRWTDAAAVAEDGLATFGDFPHTYEFTFVQARELETRGLLSQAREKYSAVIDSNPGNKTETAAIAQWRIGEIYFHRENYTAAIESYRKVDANYSFAQWKTAAILQAGKCQEHLGNWKHAARLYTQLIERFPQSVLAGQAKQRLVLIERQAQAPSQPNAELKRR